MKFKFHGSTEEWESFIRVILREAQDPIPFSPKKDPEKPNPEPHPDSSKSDLGIDPREEELPECLRSHTAGAVREKTSALKDLPEISLDDRILGWSTWKEFVVQWLQNFEVQGAVQPDRGELMKNLGSGRHAIPILVMGYEVGSLQKLIVEVYKQAFNKGSHRWEITSESLDFIERVSGTMCQVSHSGFPDLSGLHDYTLRWRREFNV